MLRIGVFVSGDVSTASVTTTVAEARNRRERKPACDAARNSTMPPSMRHGWDLHQA
jgi:hypothetical protein